MGKWSRAASYLALLVLFTACGGSSPSPTQPSTSTPSAAASSYLDELLGIMQANSINRYTIDWTSFRQAYQLLRTNPRVAVLTNCFVASSGEAAVIAFRGRPSTRSFGTPTAGVSTANSSIKLSDGAWLYLTVSVMADRTLTRYGDVVAPDEVISDPAQTVQRAIDWLLQ